MLLSNILKGIKYEVIQGNTSLNISSINYDSRKIQSDSLFICIKGFKTDGHNFIKNALDNGATAIVVENNNVIVPKEITVIRVDNSRREMSRIAANFYNNISSKLTVVGITGTNGKTSTAYFVSTLLNRLGQDTGMIGTIGNYMRNKYVNYNTPSFTTPLSIDLHNIIDKMHRDGAKSVVMEVSSAALEFNRVDDCKFDVGVFTTLEPEHLEDHGTFENYKKAKTKLFKLCKNAVINSDEDFSKEIEYLVKEKIISYGILNNADVMAKNIIMTGELIKCDLKYKTFCRDVVMNFTGKYNIYNMLAAISVCLMLGFDFNEIIDSIEYLYLPEGRLENIKYNDINIYIDYAHTPEAFELLLSGFNKIKKSRIISVFGLTGDRYKEKRPIIGEIASKYSDIVIITTDNPGSERLEDIACDIQEGINEEKCKYYVINDRKEAIKTALRIAQKNDYIFLLGKGHESSDLVNGKKIKHDKDSKIVKDLIKLFKEGC